MALRPPISFSSHPSPPLQFGCLKSLTKTIIIMLSSSMNLSLQTTIFLHESLLVCFYIFFFFLFNQHKPDSEFPSSDWLDTQSLWLLEFPYPRVLQVFLGSCSILASGSPSTHQSILTPSNNHCLSLYGDCRFSDSAASVVVWCSRMAQLPVSWKGTHSHA